MNFETLAVYDHANHTLNKIVIADNTKQLVYKLENASAQLDVMYENIIKSVGTTHSSLLKESMANQLYEAGEQKEFETLEESISYAREILKSEGKVFRPREDVPDELHNAFNALRMKIYNKQQEFEYQLDIALKKLHEMGDMLNNYSRLLLTDEIASQGKSRVNNDISLEELIERAENSKNIKTTNQEVKAKKPRKLKLIDLQFTDRSLQALQAAGIKDLAGLLDLKFRDFRKIPGIGKASCVEFAASVAKYPEVFKGSNICISAKTGLLFNGMTFEGNVENDVGKAGKRVVQIGNSGIWINFRSRKIPVGDKAYFNLRFSKDVIPKIEAY